MGPVPGRQDPRGLAASVPPLPAAERPGGGAGRPAGAVGAAAAAVRAVHGPAALLPRHGAGGQLDEQAGGTASLPAAARFPGGLARARAAAVGQVTGPADGPLLGGTGPWDRPRVGTGVCCYGIVFC